jgi:hypothetical protein
MAPQGEFDEVGDSVRIRVAFRDMTPTMVFVGRTLTDKCLKLTADSPFLTPGCCY